MSTTARSAGSSDGSESAALQKEAWLEEKKLEWENNQRERARRLSLANAPVGSLANAPAEPDDAARKREWLRQRRQEHEALRRRGQGGGGEKPAEPDDSLVKREWLRRQRLQHERWLAQRSQVSSSEPSGSNAAPVEPDEAAVKREWLRRQRQQHERTLASRAAQHDDPQAAPLVDSMLLSSGAAPSDRERYIQQIQEERSFAQRDRRRMSNEAARRPSIPIASPNVEMDASAMDDVHLANLDDEQYAYFFNYAECYESEKGEVLSTTSAAVSASSTTRSNATAAGVEEEAMEALEALEALRLQGLTHDGHLRPSCSSRGSSSPGQSRPSSGMPRLSLSPGILPPSCRSGPSSARGIGSFGLYEELLPSPAPDRFNFGIPLSSRVAPPPGAAAPQPVVVPEDERAPQLAELTGGEEAQSGSGGNLSRRDSRDSLGISFGSSPYGSDQGSPMPPRYSPNGTPLSPRSSVLRLEDITVLKRR